MEIAEKNKEQPSVRYISTTEYRNVYVVHTIVVLLQGQGMAELYKIFRCG